MAQLERTRRSTDSPKTPKAQTSPTFEQLLRVDEAYWSPTTSPTSGMNHGHEECLSPSHNRKSVLSKVKERAKKLRHTLSGRKNIHGNELTDDNSTPTSGDTLDDSDDDERINDPEYLGAPMYESEAAPDNLKENARQHPRAVPVVSENHRMPNRTKPSEAMPENEKPVRPNMTVTGAVVSETFAPAYAAMSDATHKIASKIAGLTIAPSEAQEAAATPPTQILQDGTNDETARHTARIAVPSSSSGFEAKKIRDKMGNLKQYAACSSPQTWDKGVSVKEYFMNKLEPGEDERALSQAITEAISPRRITNNTGVVEKVKEAVTSFFWQQEPVSNSMAKPASSFSAVPPHSSVFPPSARPTNSHSSKPFYTATANSSPRFPRSSNAHEVLEEENHGKILQAN